jgi:diguanylate cyclase (GGDEF)-like protein
MLIRKTLHNEKQRNLLQQEKNQFTKRDPLTGLHNYQEYQKRLTELIAKKSPFQLILVDCQNFKSLNLKSGFKIGNEVLVRIATLFRTHLNSPLLLARIGGDQFAIAIDLTKTKIETVELLLDQIIPSLVGLNLRYGSGLYPESGKTKEEVMAAAENELFSKKRDSWLKREEALFRSEKLRAVGEMAAGMAHEIRNPLTTIKGFLQVSRYNGYQIGPYYETIMNEISRMSELTAEFLQFSRPQAIQYKDQSFQECLDRILSLTQSEASRQGHEIFVQKPAQPILVRVDRDRIVQVILNLIKNAFEAMNTPGTVTITLSRSHEYATLTIRDTGVGIPEEYMNAIFQPFFTSKEKGTGLGLSICQKIIQDHDGTIDVWSEQNQGTMFTINLPLASSFIEPKVDLGDTI